ncbi:NAD-dependent epimerase/dehydratase family protein [Candidatus Nitrosotenuis uzonensis]|uniref:UDP-glucose 4-epimerase n=1 Tax=Candidatus Nitrosotenuis uzonensis TaxID=1407055 RepID=V6AV87_9ARCH|nr:NAD-dependent epimerase/dehydratase family protein [Candidatus Nitrosotenuis uzonensis]CDI06472.1 putative UDP-glucose 4-epimerase [Candidatus Nitrosotenuis uzonensis]
MNQVFVTGGSGFVGSHLVDKLVEDGKKVTVLDDFSNGNQENLRSVKDKIKIIDFDISGSWETLSDTNPDVIFHLATHPRSFSLQNPVRNMEVNVLGTLNVLEFAKKKRSKVIYTSNSGICGDPKFLPVTEDHQDDCKTPYDANKLVGENYAKIYHEIHGLHTITFRLATVYGERQRPNLRLGWKPLIPQLVEDIESGRNPIINWDGEQTRDLIHVDDVVRALILGAESEKYGGEMFLLSTNVETSVNKVLQLISKITGKNVEVKYVDKLPGDLRRMVLSYEKAKNAFGFVPQISVEIGIQRYVNWYRKNKR